MFKYLLLGILLTGCAINAESDLEIQKVFIQETEICQANNQICPGPTYDVTGETGTCNQQNVCVVCNGFDIDDKVNENLNECVDFFCRLDNEMYASIHEEKDDGGTCFTKENKLGTCNQGICQGEWEIK